MDLYSFAPIAAVLDTAYSALSALVRVLEPVAGTSSALIAIVVLTAGVRLALVPVGLSQVRAERTRRRLAPALHELRRRFASNPAMLQRKMMELYKREGVSPAGGCLPLLVQAPVLSVLYGLFVLGTINGHPNTLLDGTLGWVSLGSSMLAALGTTPAGQVVAVFAPLLTALLAVAALARRAALAQARLDAVGLQPVPAATAWLSWAPFATVIVAMVVPLAATVYLAVSTAWSLGERAVLRAHLR